MKKQLVKTEDSEVGKCIIQIIYLFLKKNLANQSN